MSSGIIKKQLESINIEAGIIITGASRLCRVEKLFSELGWESLQSRRNKHKRTSVSKILNGFTPNYLVDLVLLLIQEATRYNLRNSNDIRTIRTNSNLFYNSFFPASIRTWNNLPGETKEATSVALFSRSLLPVCSVWKPASLLLQRPQEQETYPTT